MGKTGADQAAGSSGDTHHWTLIRGARQLLTLRGSSGPRRGSAMSDLSIITDGAVLIRDGVIEEIGTTRRIENLAPARRAREIDATGKIVIPAFVDPDIALAAPAPHRPDHSRETDIRRMSMRRLESHAALIVSDLARYGVLTTGSHTRAAPDLQNTIRALRLHHAMQSRPLRIRSVFSPPLDASPDQFQKLTQNWIPAVLRKKLASVLELAGVPNERLRALAIAAASTGFSIRFRAQGPPDPLLCELAYSAGAIAMLGPVSPVDDVARTLADTGCISVLAGAEVMNGAASPARQSIDEGIPIALASGYRTDAAASMNPQFLLSLATQRLKMTPGEAIVAATYNAACSLRLSHVTGSLAPGKYADLCVMDVDRFEELPRRAGHHDVWLVIRAGKIIYRRAGLISD